MPAELIAPRFMCRSCTVPSFVIAGPMSDAAAVRCGCCDAELGPWSAMAAEIRTTLAQRSDRKASSRRAARLTLRRRCV